MRFQVLDFQGSDMTSSKVTVRGGVYTGLWVAAFGFSDKCFGLVVFGICALGPFRV